MASYNSPQLIATNRDIVRENNCKCENIKLVSKLINGNSIATCLKQLTSKDSFKCFFKKKMYVAVRESFPKRQIITIVIF